MFRSSTKDRLSLTVYNTGCEKCDSLHSWGTGIRDHFLIHHIISGKGEYTTPYGSYQLFAGDTFIIYPNTEVSYTADKDNPWEYCWIGFSGSDAPLLIAQTNFTMKNPVISTDFNGELKQSIDRIFNCSGQSATATTKMTGELYLTLALIIDKSSSGASSNDYINSAKRFIAYNYSRAISIEDIADYAGVSRYTLYRTFKEQENKSPAKYLSEYRIKQASRLLENTKLSVFAVAQSSGYDDCLYFSRVFKKITGLSPTDYRHKTANCKLGKE